MGPSQCRKTGPCTEENVLEGWSSQEQKHCLYLLYFQIPRSLLYKKKGQELCRTTVM